MTRPSFPAATGLHSTAAFLILALSAGLEQQSLTSPQVVDTARSAVETCCVHQRDPYHISSLFPTILILRALPLCILTAHHPTLPLHCTRLLGRRHAVATPTSPRSAARTPSPAPAAATGNFRQCGTLYFRKARPYGSRLKQRAAPVRVTHS